jgi:hypothetical protein
MHQVLMVSCNMEKLRSSINQSSSRWLKYQVFWTKSFIDTEQVQKAIYNVHCLSYVEYTNHTIFDTIWTCQSSELVLDECNKI